MVRVNGFDRPYHPLQVFTWILFPAILFGYYGIVLWLIEAPWLRWGSLGVYSFLAAVTFVCAWITSAVDPRDPRVVHNRISDARTLQDPGSCSSRCCECFAAGSLSKRQQAYVSERETIVCYLCEARVESTSKHCRFCDKCVVRFDHHCKWLNTCIGRRNYNYFLGVIASTWIFSVLQLALTGYYLCLVVIPSARPSRLVNRTERHWIGSKHVVTACLIVWTAVLLPLVALVGQLGAFHAMLVYEGLTTYEYILNEQRRDSQPESGSRRPPPRHTQRRAAETTNELTSLPKQDSSCCHGERQPQKKSQPNGDVDDDSISSAQSTPADQSVIHVADS